MTSLAQPETDEAAISHGTAVTTCMDCGWTGESLDDARIHARQRGHRNFRTVTVTLRDDGGVTDEIVEVHQL